MLKSQKTTLLLLGLVITICSATAVFSGEMVDLICKNPTCDYKGNLGLGGGFNFESITGYCTRDKQFVDLTWKRGEKAPEPITVWNPQTGQSIVLYKCPKCGDPFLPIKDLKELKYCPKCNHPTLESHVNGNYD